MEIKELNKRSSMVPSKKSSNRYANFELLINELEKQADNLTLKLNIKNPIYKTILV
jgi:hypothetical protein